MSVTNPASRQATGLATSGGGGVDLAAAEPPAAGQVLTADDEAHASWQTPTGGGWTKTAAAPVAHLAPGESFDLDHPASTGLPQVWAEIAGDSDTAQPTPVADGADFGAAAWLQDDGVSGHFSADPGNQVVRGCAITIGEATAAIVAMDGDGTGLEAVELTDAIPSGPIARIDPVLGWAGGSLVTSGSGGTYVETPELALARCELLTAGQVAGVGTLTGVSGDLSGTGAVGRAAFSVDGGASWIAWDGTGWVTVAEEDLEDDGCQVAFGTLAGSDGLAIAAGGWAALLALAVAGEAGLWLLVGLRGTAVDQSAITGLLASWVEPSTDELLALGHTGGMMAGGGLRVIRVSTTRTRFLNAAMWITFDNVRALVWTG